LSNPPAEDAAGGEAYKSLRLPCLPDETFYFYHWGEMFAHLYLYLTFIHAELISVQ
jgi:hypothetical protein